MRTSSSRRAGEALARIEGLYAVRLRRSHDCSTSHKQRPEPVRRQLRHALHARAALAGNCPGTRPALDRDPSGPYGPVRATLVQVYGATTGRPSAAARCSGPVSLAAITSACASSAASCGRVVFPVTFENRTDELLARLPPQRRLRRCAPTKTAVPPNRACARRASAAKCSGGQRLVSQREPTSEHQPRPGQGAQHVLGPGTRVRLNRHVRTRAVRRLRAPSATSQ